MQIRNGEKRGAWNEHEIERTLLAVILGDSALPVVINTIGTSAFIAAFYL